MTSVKAKAYSAASATSRFGLTSIPRRAATEQDVQIEILFCGICHSDLHYARDEWHDFLPTVYPCVPGHEIIGRVTRVGSGVTKFKEGDVVGVGCLVDSDRTCANCQAGLEQFCESGPTLTYNSIDPHSGGVTYGGYSKSIVVDQDFVLRLPSQLDPAASAPLLCAGITTYSPLRKWQVGPGWKVGVAGLGGLGHMAVKFAHAFGAEVTLFTTSEEKSKDARRFGADEVVISKDDSAMKQRIRRYDLVLDTISASHNLDPYLDLLKRDGALVLVGIPAEPIGVNSFRLIAPRRQLAGSLMGGIRETQDMLDFCAERGITCEVERIAIDQINEAYERMLRKDVRYRFVIDLASLE